jgi:hypothetical protein
MFREFLKKDLIAIFEIQQVDFSNSLAHFESELQILNVVIDPEGVKNNFRDGENYFAVDGTIEYLSDQTQTNFGFFNQRMILSQYKSKGDFKLIGRESNDQLANDSELVSDRLIIKKSQKFCYRISIPFNKPIADIEGFESQAHYG